MRPRGKRIPDLMIRGAWVQDPYTGRLIPKAQFERRLKSTEEYLRMRSNLSAPQVMRDIQPFLNVAVDGREIGSRSAKREMMKRHDLQEVGTEKRITKRNWIKRTPVRESLKKNLQVLESR